MTDLMGMFGTLAVNAAALIGLMVAVSPIVRRLAIQPDRRYRILLGLGFGLAGIGVMLVSVEVADGILIDGRNVAIAVASLFAGPGAAALAAVCIGGTRMLLGGDGAIFGALQALLVWLGCLAYLRYLPIDRIRPPAGRLLLLGLLLTAGNAVPAFLAGVIGSWPLALAANVGLIYLAAGACFYTGCLVATAKLLAREHAQIAAEKSLQERDERLQALAETSNDWFWETNANDRLTYLSARIEDVLGVNQAEFMGRTRDHLLVDTIDGDFARSRQAVEAREPFRNLVWALRLPAGEVRWLRSSGVPLTDSAGHFTGYLGVTTDVTEHRHAQKTIQWQASHDPLTDLPNRALFHSRLQRMLTHADGTGRRIALLFIDLDQFKRINDSFGHTFGDQLISAAAERIVGCTSPADVVARLGGDEFTVITDDLDDPIDVERIARRIISAFEAPFLLERREVYVSASLGIAIFPDNARSADALMREADAALYRAKDGGRNDFRFFTPELNERSRERTMMESQLRRALEREELYLCYQPQIRTSDREIVGVEALLRWENEVLGQVPTPQFIALAEDSGLIVPIGTWVLETACRQIAELRTGRLPLSLAVNVSSRQFTTPGLLDAVQNALSVSGLPAGALELEITESVLMADLKQTYETLEALSALGIQLSLDDFGTGYSSLSYLRRFPVNVLKIDRAFVNDVTKDAGAAAVVESIIAMAHGLKLTVVSEGVETPEQHAFMVRHGVDRGQGYLYGRPMLLKDFTETYCAREVA